jgi:membrane protein implicated in regulation of membrane protease activity
MEMFAFLGEIQPWYWWALAAILLSIEILTPTFYFLWPGLAAILVGLIAFLVPGLGTDVQVLSFAFLAVVLTFGFKRFAPKAWTSAEPHPTLNRRAEGNIGRIGKAALDFAGGQGAVLLDDTRWSAVTQDGSNPVQGELLVIVAADGVVLKVGRPH